MYQKWILTCQVPASCIKNPQSWASGSMYVKKLGEEGLDSEIWNSNQCESDSSIVLYNHSSLWIKECISEQARINCHGPNNSLYDILNVPALWSRFKTFKSSLYILFIYDLSNSQNAWNSCIFYRTFFVHLKQKLFLLEVVFVVN